MEQLAGAPLTHDDSARGGRPIGQPSVASSLEHLVAGSQGVIAKRIDLALLEGQELLRHTVQGAALVGVAVVVVAAAWFAVAACVVLLVIPDGSWIVRLAAFGSLNGGCAVGLVALAMRGGRPKLRVRPNRNGSNTAA